MTSINTQEKAMMVQLLFNLFQEQENFSLLDDTSIEDFYQYIIFELDSIDLLTHLNITNYNDLRNLFIQYNNELELEGD